MEYSVYSIRDKLQGFMSPALDVNDMAAKRNFAYAINNNPGIMNFQPSDYDFYRVGIFDSQSGELRPVAPIEYICNGVDVIYEKSESKSE